MNTRPPCYLPKPPRARALAPDPASIRRDRAFAESLADLAVSLDLLHRRMDRLERRPVPAAWHPIEHSDIREHIPQGFSLPKKNR